jgi:type IV pilus assembly protein PilZ
MILVLIWERGTVIENRRHQRAPLDVSVEFVGKGSEARLRGRARDISVGGMFIETTEPLAFASELTVHITLPAQKQSFMLPGVVRWARDGGMGVQFGLVGARETHAITELTLGK